MQSNYFPEGLPIEALGFFAHARACKVPDAERFAYVVLEVRPQNVSAEDIFNWLHETQQPTCGLFLVTFGPEALCVFCDEPTRARCNHQIAYGANCELAICASCTAPNGKCRIHKNGMDSPRHSTQGVITSIRRAITGAVNAWRENTEKSRQPDAVNFYRAQYARMKPFYVRETDALAFSALIRNGNIATSFKRVPNRELPELQSQGTSEGIEIFMETTR